MVKLVILFRRPRAQADQLLVPVRERLLPAFRAIRGMQRAELAISRESALYRDHRLGRRDRRGPPFLALELYFADDTALNAAMSSPEGTTALNELDQLAGHYITTFEAEVSTD